MWQPNLFGAGEPDVDTAFGRCERIWLDDTAWVDRMPGWVGGSTALFEELRRNVAWRHEQRTMYERVVDVPRLTARFPQDAEPPAIVDVMADALTRRYHRNLRSISAALYRDGDDSVAFHRDRHVRTRTDAVVAIVSLGGRRNFLMRPLDGGSAHSINVGWGDLLVMGGTANNEWEHGVPKCARADPRIALMFREG